MLNTFNSTQVMAMLWFSKLGVALSRLGKSWDHHYGFPLCQALRFGNWQRTRYELQSLVEPVSLQADHMADNKTAHNGMLAVNVRLH